MIQWLLAMLLVLRTELSDSLFTLHIFEFMRIFCCGTLNVSNLKTKKFNVSTIMNCSYPKVCRMTDDSKFVYRWEIEDAKAKYATGRVESREFVKGGFRWITGFERVDDQGKIYLRSAVDYKGPWKCEVDLSVWEIGRDGYRYARGKGHFFFDESNCIQHYIFLHPWKWLTDGALCVNGRNTFEFEIRIISSERGAPIASIINFDKPNNKSNVALVIEEKKLHVSKEYLAFHSPVFFTMFFGDFAEKGKEEVEIKDLVYEEFRDLLELIYLRVLQITDRTALHICKLADRFQIESIFEHSKNHLTQSKGIDVVKKLLMADQYNLVSLRDHCLNEFNNSNDLITKLKSSNEFENFSDGMKVAIYGRIFALASSN